MEHNGLVSIYIRNRVYVVFPDKDVDLGTFVEGDTISIRKRRVGLNWEINAVRVPMTDAPAQ